MILTKHDIKALKAIVLEDKKFLGAPLGIDHPKAYIPFEIIQRVRWAKYRGRTLSWIQSRYPDIPRDTLRDWIYRRTRIHA